MTGKYTENINICKDYFVKLSNEPIIFEPISKVNNVFYDPTNQQVFTLRANGSMGVNIKGPGCCNNMSFIIQDRGEVLSIKLSSDKRILALQRTLTSIDCLNIIDGTVEDVEYSQSCKNKNAKLIGFVWSAPLELVLITSEGLELYQVLPEKKNLKLVKQLNLPLNWFAWNMENRIMIISSGSVGNVLHVIQIRPSGTFQKLSKFEVDPPMSIAHGSNPSPLQQQNCLLASLYGHLYVCVLQKHLWGCGRTGTEIVLFKLRKDGPAKKTDVVLVEKSGRIAINFVDSLILVHHQELMQTFVYDIAMPGQSNGYVVYHRPILTPQAIAPVKLASKCVPTLSVSLGPEVDIALYSSAWVVFLPNVIIDGSLGCMWNVELDVNSVRNLIADKAFLVDFLTNRSDGKHVLLSVCTELAITGAREARELAAAPKVKQWHTKSSRASSPSSSTDTSGEAIGDGDTTRAGGGAGGGVLAGRLAEWARVFARLAEVMRLAGCLDEAVCPSSAATTLATAPLPSLGAGGEARSIAVAAVSATSHSPYSSSPRATHLNVSTGAADQLVVSAVGDAVGPGFRRPFVVTQSEIYIQVFRNLIGNETASSVSLATAEAAAEIDFLYSVLMEFLCALTEYDIAADPVIYELLVNTIIRSGNYVQLNHCIQCGVLVDSKAVAFQLLSMSAIYPPAQQLALDMLKRLSIANEEILEVLLSKEDPLNAIRFCQSRRYLLERGSTARQILEVAKQLSSGRPGGGSGVGCGGVGGGAGTDTEAVYFAVFRFFDALNHQQMKDNYYDSYVKHFAELFGEKALSGS